MAEHEIVLRQLQEARGQQLGASGQPDLLEMAGRLGMTVHYVQTDDSLDAFGWWGKNREAHIVVNQTVSKDAQEHALAREMALLLKNRKAND